MSSSVLVTGGSGFIGASLVPKLIEQGYKVKVLDNLSKGSRVYLEKYDYDFIHGDIRNVSDLQNALGGVSGVIHLAASGSVIDSVADPLDNFDNNVFGTFNLINQCRLFGIKKFVFSSTGGALIGDADPPVNESSFPKPISPYGSSKLCCEAYCSSFSVSYDMDIVALRFANVVGDNSWHKKGAVNAFMKSIVSGDPIIIYGDGTSTRDFLYVGDLCDGIIRAYNIKLNGFTPIHLASGKETTIKELAHIILNVAGKDKHPISYLSSRTGEVDRNFASFDLAKELLGFVPKTDLEKAIQITWNSFKNNISKIS